MNLRSASRLSVNPRRLRFERMEDRRLLSVVPHVSPSLVANDVGQEAAALEGKDISTTAGTASLVADINDRIGSGDSSPSSLVNVDGVLYFAA
ncbi:MAG: hypothetical protein V3R99_13070, partial [Thermoguttaceae bacterium]